MKDKRKIEDARQDKDGNISAVRIEGNQNFTSLDKAIEMTDKGEVDAVVVTRRDGSQHLRTRPDDKTGNNLDELAKD